MKSFSFRRLWTMLFKDGGNMEQEKKINIEETTINLGYVKKEPENTEPEFQENQYKIASNFDNVFQESPEQKNNGDSLIGFLDGYAIMETGSVKSENVEEENKDLIQETLDHSVSTKLEIIECHCCKVLFEQWEHLENHMLNCLDKKYNRFYENKLDIQQTPTKEILDTERNGEISCLTLTETMNSTSTDEISISYKEGSFNEKKHKCSECFYQTNYKSNLNIHLKIHNNIEPFECNICKKKYSRKSNLKMHIMNMHSNINEKKYKCIECYYQTNHKYQLKSHTLNQHSNRSKKDIKQFECKICKKRYTQKSNLNVHIEDKHSNTNEKYKCSKCSYRTDCKTNLRKHLNIHNNSKPFECYICKKKFTQKGYLKKHIMNIHSNTNEKKYKCTECSYHTNVKHTLSNHINNHNTKPFECDICKKKFSHKNNLKAHKMDLHLNISENKYKCTKCSYQTNVKGRFSNHINSHIKPFECAICKKGFAMKGRLKIHVEDKHSNTNEKKYKCTECSYQTNHKEHLSQHLNVH